MYLQYGRESGEWEENRVDWLSSLHDLWVAHVTGCFKLCKSNLHLNAIWLWAKLYTGVYMYIYAFNGIIWTLIREHAQTSLRPWPGVMDRRCHEPSFMVYINHSTFSFPAIFLVLLLPLVTCYCFSVLSLYLSRCARYFEWHLSISPAPISPQRL